MNWPTIHCLPYEMAIIVISALSLLSAFLYSFIPYILNTLRCITIKCPFYIQLCQSHHLLLWNPDLWLSLNKKSTPGGVLQFHSSLTKAIYKGGCSNVLLPDEAITLSWPVKSYPHRQIPVPSSSVARKTSQLQIYQQTVNILLIRWRGLLIGYSWPFSTTPLHCLYSEPSTGDPLGWRPHLPFEHCRLTHVNCRQLPEGCHACIL